MLLFISLLRTLNFDALVSFCVRINGGSLDSLGVLAVFVNQWSIWLVSFALFSPVSGWDGVYMLTHTGVEI